MKHFHLQQFFQQGRVSRRIHTCQKFVDDRAGTRQPDGFESIAQLLYLGRHTGRNRTAIHRTVSELPCALSWHSDACPDVKQSTGDDVLIPASQVDSRPFRPVELARGMGEGACTQYIT